MAKEKIVYNEDFEVAYLPGIAAAVSTSVKSFARPSNTISKDDRSRTMIYWGEANDHPQQVIADVRKDPEIGTLLNTKAELAYAGGLEWGIPARDPSGNEILTELSEAENNKVTIWCQRTNIDRYLIEGLKDLSWFNNAFVEMILQGDRSSIIQLCVQPAEECRLGPQDESTGLNAECLINAQWPNASSDDQFTKRIPLLDTYFDPAAQLREKKTGLKFIYPLAYMNPGDKFYALATWNSIRESGWLKIAALIPAFKEAVLKNQSTINLHIEIADKFWEAKYEGYKTKSQEDKRKIKQEELKSIQETIAGASQAGKNIYSPFIFDMNIGKEIPLIKINPIDIKIKDGQYVEDGKDASTYKYTATSMHPALIGSLPNSAMGGAGSNIREAYNLNVLKSKAMQDLILEPLNNLVIPYNGWSPKMKFRLKNQFMTTLDAGRETNKSNG